MNWDAVGAISELVAAIGVILSLIYLAMQIRRDSNATISNTTQLRATGAREALLAIATTESLADLLSRASDTVMPSVEYLVQSRGFTKAEALRVNSYWMNFVRTAEANLKMPMSELERNQTLTQTLVLLDGPAKGWWEHAKMIHSKDFVELISSKLGDA